MDQRLAEFLHTKVREAVHDPFVHDLHRHHLPVLMGRSGMVPAWIKTFLFVLTPKCGHITWYLSATNLRLSFGLSAPKARHEFFPTRPVRFIPRGAGVRCPPHGGLSCWAPGRRPAAAYPSKQATPRTSQASC